MKKYYKLSNGVEIPENEVWGCVQQNGYYVLTQKYGKIIQSGKPVIIEDDYNYRINKVKNAKKIRDCWR